MVRGYVADGPSYLLARPPCLRFLCQGTARFADTMKKHLKSRRGCSR